MSDTAFQTMYRDEMIMGFEKRESLVRRTTVTETDIRGNEAVFLVADSGGAEAVSRGVDGDLPTRPDNSNQYTATLQEWHDVPEKTRFNIFASQGNQRALMQQTCMSVINRKIDKDIHAALDLATTTWGSAAAATFTLITKAMTILRNNFAEEDAPLFALITPAFHGYMQGFKEFASADYSRDPRFEGQSKSKVFDWNGVTWIVDAALDGVGTSDATCFMYSMNAIGHACDKESLDTAVGYDAKNDKSWARCSMFMGSKLLQNSGVVKMPHDDSALSA